MEPSPPAVRPGDLLASKYRVERVLGQGGMGVVVAAQHEQLGFRVAVKFMLPAALQDAQMKDRFLREARAAGRLRGEHVARVMDFGTLDDGAPYIVMEFLEGKDLEGLIAERGRLTEREAIELLLQACKGMEEAHAQGIVHRDLKPQNLFLTQRPDGSPLVKVLDFGISKLVETDAQSMSMTASTTIMGSPLYMAPEQLRSSKNVDARADIYSLGVILYQLVSGSLPVQASTLGELFEYIFVKSIEPLRERLPGVSPGLDALVMRCLAKEPAARFANIAELATALTAALATAGVGAHSLEVVSRPMTAAVAGESEALRVARATTGPITTLGNAASSASLREAQTPTKRGPLVAGAALGIVAVIAIAALAMRSPKPGTSLAGPSSASATGVVAPVNPASAAQPSVVLAPTPSASAPVADKPAPSAATPSLASAHLSPAAPKPGKSPAAIAPSSRPTPKPAGADPFGSPD